jgi:hypothetical protein
LAGQARRGFKVHSVLPLTPLVNSAAFTWGEFLLGKLRQLFATTRRHSPTAVSGPPGSGIVFPFTSFQGTRNARCARRCPETETKSREEAQRLGSEKGTVETVIRSTCPKKLPPTYYPPQILTTVIHSLSLFSTSQNMHRC